MKLGLKDHINSWKRFPKDFPKKIKYSSWILKITKNLGQTDEFSGSVCNLGVVDGIAAEHMSMHGSNELKTEHTTLNQQ